MSTATHVTLKMVSQTKQTEYIPISDQHGEIYTLFQTRNARKRYPLGRHIPIWLIYGVPPPPPPPGQTSREKITLIKANLQNSRQQNRKGILDNPQTAKLFFHASIRSNFPYCSDGDPKSLKREAMLMGQASDHLWYTRYFRGATFSQNLKCGGFQFEY